jgi:hypothetical protein
LAAGREVLLADDAPTMVDGIHRLLSDRGYWESMRDASRRKARTELAWNSMLEDHVRVLLDLTDRKQ